MKHSSSSNGQVKSLRKDVPAIIVGPVAIAIAIVTAAAVHGDAVKSYSIGDRWLGADFNFSYVDWASTDKYTAQFAGNAIGTVLKLKVPLASGNTTLTVKQPSNCNAVGSLKLINHTVANWNKNFTSSTDFSTPPFLEAELGGKAVFAIGWIPLTVSAKADIKVNAHGNAAVIYYPSTHRFGVHAALGPAVEAGVSGSVALDVGLAAAGIEGSISLVNVALLGSVDYIPRNGLPAVSYALSVDGKYPEGSLKLFERIGVGWLSHTWKQTLFDFGGGNWSIPITSGTRQL